jgi:hypothetical protein
MREAVSMIRITLPALIALLLLVPPTGHAQTPNADEFRQQVQAGTLKCGLDRLVDIPAVWEMRPDALDAAFALPDGATMDKSQKSPYFNWMTRDRDRAVFMRRPYHNITVDFTLFEGALPVEEVVADFIDGSLNGISFSLYNRGDSGEIGKEEFSRRLKLCGQKMGDLLGVRPVARKANPTQGLLAEGWTWVSQKGMAVLEHNPEALAGKPEFLRLKIAPREAKGVYAAAFQSRPAAARVSDLPRNVVRDGDEVFIKGVPMVDQGPKGYCVVASTQRLFEYYGIPADQHQIAQVAGADARRGTNSLAMSEALGRIDYRFKTRFKIHAMGHEGGLVQVDQRKMTVSREFSQSQFEKTIRNSIDAGIPLLWSLELGRYPEDPPIAMQQGGGHMRLIIGYNDETNRLIFTDSWGAGHEIKRMGFQDAYNASTGLFTMTPTVR